MTRLVAGVVIVAAIGVALAAGRGESSSRSSWVLLALDGGAPADGPTRLAARHGPDRPLVDLATGFAVARDANVSPDGRRVVFAGRRAETDPWSLWEVGAAGGGLRQLRLDREAREPAYLDQARVVYAGRVDDEWALFVHGPSSTDRVTHRPGDQRWPTVLSTGRVVFAVRRPTERAPTRYLWMQQDGTGAELLLRASPGAFFEGPVREVEPNVIRFAERDAAGVLRARVVDVARLDSVQRSVPDEAVSVDGVTDGERVVQATTVAIRPVPPAPISVVDRTKATGTLYGIDARMSDSRANPGAGAPVTLRVLGVDGVLGSVPLADDGSFFLEVPADVALRLETLDAAGRLVRGPSDWVWVRPNESRGCIGCHETRTMAPPNRVPLALAGAPAHLAGATP